MENKILELSPKHKQAIKIVERIKALKIDGIEDEIGYQIVKEAIAEARNFIGDLSELRLGITRQYDDAKKQLIGKEREIIDLIQPVRESLLDMKQEIDDEKLMDKIRKDLPARKELLKSIDVEVSDEELLLMKNDKFEKFYTDKKGEYLEAKEARLQAAEDKIAEDKRIADEAKRVEDEKNAAVAKALKDAADKVEKDKQDLIDAQAKKEKEDEDAKAQKILQDAAKNKARNENEKYQSFLIQCGYNEETKADFKIFKGNQGEIVVYKKVGSIIL